MSAPGFSNTVRLGLRENLGQFSLLVLINAFVGGMVGLERTVVPLVGTEEFGIGSELVVAREGRFTRRTHAVRHARVQSVRLSQGPLQRRLGLADVHVDSPPGPVRVRARHRAWEDARRLFAEEERRARAARATSR